MKFLNKETEDWTAALINDEKSDDIFNLACYFE